TAADSSTDSLIGLLSGIGAHVAEFLERRRAEDLTVELARSKDEYLGLVGHELRTPITSITAYVEMLRGADPGTIAEELPDLLDVLSRNSDALREIVDRLLDLVALDSGHAKLVREPVDLTAVVSAATEAVQPAADAAGLTMTAELRPGTTVAGDAARLRQVADQLLDNAVKHTKSEGRVIVTLTRPDPAAAELTVTDTGMGIPVEDHPRLFDRFYRSQRTRDQRIPGSGLGLPVTRAIIEWHRGKIRYVPTGESGTRVVVRLPVG
ncbi:His Kinase A (phospho-acceptor) domain-containing protein, partial [Actinoplanes regularis]